jgi:hypothetical protein
MINEISWWYSNGYVNWSQSAFNTCRKNIRKYELEFDEYHYNTGGPWKFLK